MFLPAQLLTSVASAFALHRIPKKYAFVACCFVLSLAIASIATFSLLKSHYEEEDGGQVPDWLTSLDWIPIAGAMVAMVCQSFGILTTLQILMGEVFPTDIRAIAAGTTND